MCGDFPTNSRENPENPRAGKENRKKKKKKKKTKKKKDVRRKVVLCVALAVAALPGKRFACVEVEPVDSGVGCLHGGRRLEHWCIHTRGWRVYTVCGCWRCGCVKQRLLGWCALKCSSVVAFQKERVAIHNGPVSCANRGLSKPLNGH